MEAIARATARVLPVCPEGDVLLLQDQDPGSPGRLRWGSIGGGVDPGESLADAAVREMWEETGLTIGSEALVGPVHRGAKDVTWNGVAYRTHSTFFAIRLDRDVEVDFDHLDADERGNLVAWKWWSPHDAARSEEMIFDDLPAIMSAAVGAVLGGNG